MIGRHRGQHQPRAHDEARLLSESAAAVTPDDPGGLDWHRRYVSGQSARLTEDLEMVRRLVRPDSKVLEVGATPPILTAALARSGFDVTGIDIDPSRYAKAIEELSLTVVACDIEAGPLPFPDDSFDCVLCNEVFEHLRIDPLAALGELRRVLRPGGLLLLSTPNLRSYRGVLNLVVHGRGWAVGADPVVEYGKLRSLGHMGHVREYTAAEMSAVLAHCGFVVDAVVPRGAVRSRIERVVTAFRPSLRPFVSIVARAGAGGSSGPTGRR